MATAAPNRKKCPDCGKRGNWPKQLSPIDPCPECTAKRLHQDAIRKKFYDRCPNHLRCEPRESCPVCVEYFSSPTHAFFKTL